MAFQDGVKRSNPVILEPIMKVQIIMPEDYLGDITGDLSAKRGRIDSMEDRMGIKVVNAMVPLSELFGYATKLRSMTQGRGSFTMEFDHYDQVPGNIAQEIIEGKRK